MFDVLLVTGGAGSGKTSTADAWAASRAGLAAHLSHDTVLDFVKSGMVSPAASTSEEAERQWRIGIDVCVAACRIYAAAGMRCAVDTFLLPTRLPLWTGLRDLNAGVVVLRPDVEVAVSRNAVRLRDSGWGVAEWQVRANHEAMGAWMDRHDVLVINNSEVDLLQVLAIIDAWEARSPSLLLWSD